MNGWNGMEISTIEDQSNRYQIIWDLGRRCSYACTYCPPHRNNKTSAFVSYKTLCKSMDSVAEYALLYDTFRKKPAKKKTKKEKKKQVLEEILNQI